MKKLTGALCLCAILATTAFAAAPATGTVDLSFTFEKLDGRGTNQFALWVENEEGTVVKTLFVTGFTGLKRGWKERPATLVNWVEQSRAADLTDAQLDAISGPTPDSGTLTYSWDLTDAEGKAVPAGNYAVVLEGTVRDENAVLYTAEVKVPLEAASQTLEANYVGEAGKDSEDYRMISNVTATVTPAK